MSLPLSSPYSGFCSSVKRFHIVSSLTSENNIARRLNLPGFRRFPRSAKSFCCNFSQFHFIYPDVASAICVLHFQRFRAPNSRAASQALMAWHRFRKHRLLRRPEETWRTLSKNRWSGARKHNVLNVLWLLTTNIFHINIYIYTSSTAQGGGGSFKNRKPIGEIGCCESGMAERILWWTERCLRSPLFLSLSLTIYLPTSLSSMYLSICLSVYLSIYIYLYQFYIYLYLSIDRSIYLSIYIYISLSLSFICLSG